MEYDTRDLGLKCGVVPVGRLSVLSEAKVWGSGQRQPQRHLPVAFPRPSRGFLSRGFERQNQLHVSSAITFLQNLRRCLEDRDENLY